MTSQEKITTQNWLETRQLDAQTWAINDRGEDICYLVCGDTSCLLIDTGWGIGDLKNLVYKLNPIPLLVVNTHGHPDHTFGNWQFPEVHIAEADMHMIGEVPSIAMRRYIAEEIISSPLPEDFDVERWMVGEKSQLILIEEGQSFDLGHRILETIAIPGHSPGSLAFLDRQRRWLFTGDTFSSGTIWLHLLESLPLNDFRDNLIRLKKWGEDFDIMYPAHGALNPLSLPSTLIDDMIHGLGEILDGQKTGVLEQTLAGDGLLCEFDSFSIIYNPDRL